MPRSASKRDSSRPQRAEVQQQRAPGDHPNATAHRGVPRRSSAAGCLVVWLSCGLIVAAGAAVYANSLHGAFVFDDRDAILDNPHIQSLWPLWQAMTTPADETSSATGRPLVCLSLAINHAIGGHDV